jgi:hypothetical protein
MERILYTLLGLELGQRSDFSALATIDLVEDITSRLDPVTFAFHRSTKFRLRNVHRIPPGLAYAEFPARVRESAVQPPPGHFGPRPRSVLAVDAAGPGGLVIQLLRQAQLECGILPATITGGEMGAPMPGGMYSVTRRELVSLLHLSIENQMLVFPAGMPLKDELIAGIAASKINGNQSEFDDMAIAIALALWASTKSHPGLFQKKVA